MLLSDGYYMHLMGRVDNFSSWWNKQDDDFRAYIHSGRERLTATFYLSDDEWLCHHASDFCLGKSSSDIKNYRREILKYGLEKNFTHSSWFSSLIRFFTAPAEGSRTGKLLGFYVQIEEGGKAVLKSKLWKDVSLIIDPKDLDNSEEIANEVEQLSDGTVGAKCELPASLRRALVNHTKFNHWFEKKLNFSSDQVNATAVSDSEGYTEPHSEEQKKEEALFATLRANLAAAPAPAPAPALATATAQGSFFSAHNRSSQGHGEGRGEGYGEGDGRTPSAAGRGGMEARVPH